MAEFHIVYFHEVCRVAFRVGHGAEHEQSAGLGHGFNHEYAGHYRFLWEVPLEEWFVGGDIFHAHDIAFAAFDDFVHQQEGVAVGQ